jgi:hypothetical protein
VTRKAEPVELSYSAVREDAQDDIAWKPTVAGPRMIALILVMCGGFWLFLLVLYFVG